MARYQDQFKLDISDIDRIERALRQEISRHSRPDRSPAADNDSRAEIKALSRLLGKIHNQKVFYAQVNATGVPAG